LINQNGNKILWLGSNLFNGNTQVTPFSNIAKGDLNGNIITANWQDVNLGDRNSNGQISLTVEYSGSKLVKQPATVGFEGSELSRKC